MIHNMHHIVILKLTKYFNILVLKFAPNFHPQILRHRYSQRINPSKSTCSKETKMKQKNILINVPNCQLKWVKCTKSDRYIDI